MSMEIAYLLFIPKFNAVGKESLDNNIFIKFFFCINSQVFLDASTHLYKRVCPSVSPSVRPLVRNAFFFKFAKMIEILSELNKNKT